jgi:hypothetical protein
MSLNLTTHILAGTTIPVGTVGAPGTTGDGFKTLLGWGTWIAYLVCVAGLIAVGATLAMTHRRGGDMGEHAGKLAAVAAGAVIVGAAPSIIGAL